MNVHANASPVKMDSVMGARAYLVVALIAIVKQLKEFT